MNHAGDLVTFLRAPLALAPDTGRGLILNLIEGPEDPSSAPSWILLDFYRSCAPNDGFAIQNIAADILRS